MQTARLTSPRWRLALALLLAPLLTVLALAGPSQRSEPAQAAGEILFPVLDVIPDSGPPGTSVQVQGSGFPPNLLEVVIGFSQDGMEQIFGVTSTDGEGNFTTLVAVPGDAVPGPATFYAETSLGRAEADFLVTDSVPIGDDKRGPPADKVPLCEVVVILERVVSHLQRDDMLRIGTRVHPGGVGKALEIDAPAGVESDDPQLPAIVKRVLLPKNAFPTKFGVDAVVTAQNQAVQPQGGRESLDTTPGNQLKCPDSRLFPFEGDFSIEIKEQIFRNTVGTVDVIYRVIVREVPPAQ